MLPRSRDSMSCLKCKPLQTSSKRKSQKWRTTPVRNFFKVIFWERFPIGRPIIGRIKNMVTENELDVILKLNLSESAKILIETLQNTEEGSSDGIQKISKYFTVGFFKDMEKYYDTVLKSERVKLDTKAEMLVFARKKAKMSALGHTIQSNLARFHDHFKAWFEYFSEFSAIYDQTKP